MLQAGRNISTSGRAVKPVTFEAVPQVRQQREGRRQAWQRSAFRGYRQEPSA